MGFTVDVEGVSPGLSVAEAATLPPDAVLQRLETARDGLGSGEVARRRALGDERDLGASGPAVVGARPPAAQRAPAPAGRHRGGVVLRRRPDDAAIIGVILVGVGRARVRQRVPGRAGGARAAHPDHATRSWFVATVTRSRSTSPISCPATSCSSRWARSSRPTSALIAADGLECDESVLTGESHAGREVGGARSRGAELAETVVVRVHGHGRAERRRRGRRGRDRHATRSSARIAAGLGERQEVTEFQTGLRKFSVLLVQVAGVLTTSIFVINLILAAAAARVAAVLARDRSRHHPAAPAGGRHDEPRDRIAPPRPEGRTGQTARVHRGSRRHRGAAHRQDGHAHRGRDQLRPRRRPDGSPPTPRCSASASSATRRPSKTGGPSAATRSTSRCGTPPSRDACRSPASARLATVPFDHDRRMAIRAGRRSVGRARPRHEGCTGVASSRCASDVPDSAHRTLDTEFAAGSRVVAVATRAAPERETLSRRRRARPRRSRASSSSSTSPSSMPPRRSSGSPGSASR